MTPPADPRALHAWFSGRPGAEQIASVFALEALARWLCRREPARALDVGHGIGATTALLAWWLRTTAELVAVDDDPFCQAEARANLGQLALRVLWFDRIPAYLGVDLAVLDGPQVRPEDWKCLNPRAVVFIEGRRREQRAQLLTTLGEDGRPCCWAEWKPRDRSKGYTVVLVEPTPRERAWFAVVRVREALLDLLGRLRGLPIGKRRPA